MSDLLNDDVVPQRKILDIARVFDDFRTYYRLLIVLLFVSMAIVIAVVMLTEPVYTATALVGPADNSDQPFGVDAGGLSGTVGGVAKHLHVGKMLGDNSNDTFDEYTSLLSSTRLAWALVNKDHILPVIFADQWDAANKRWYPRDTLVAETIDFLKRLLRRPVKPAPDVDDLMKFFDKKFSVDMSLETSFATVTFKFDNPGEAERILNLILLEADNIIRQDKRRDVSARIAYLNTALEHLTLADQKPAMIDILSQQQQEMMMVEADHRYASILIDPPHAPIKPTSPVPTIDAAIGAAVSLIAWLGIVRFPPRTGWMRRLLELFSSARGSRRRRVAQALPEARSA